MTAGADVDVLPLSVALPKPAEPAHDAGRETAHETEGWLHRLTEGLTDRIAARDPGAGLAAAGGFALGLAAMG